MKLTDILPVETWIAIEDEFVEKTGLCAGILDSDNVRITQNVKWSNDLCPQIKGDDRGKAQICSVSQAAMALEAKKTGLAVVRDCDAGIGKVVVPIFYNGEFLGTAGGCGLLFPGGEVDTFFVSKVLEMPEEEVKKVPIGVIDVDKAEEAAKWIEERIKEALQS